MGVKFDGETLRELESALYEAFPNDSSFTQMLTYGFGAELAAKLGGSGLNYGQRIFAVLEWTGSRYRHDQLVRISRRANLDNKKLLTIEMRLGTSIRTEHLLELEDLLVTENLEHDALLQMASSFDHLPSPLVQPEDVRTAFRRIVDRLASIPRQSDGTLPLYTFAQELAAHMGHEAAVEKWMKVRSAGGLQTRQQRKAAKALYLFVKCDTGYKKIASALDEIHVDMWLWRLDEHGVPLEKIPDCVCAHRTLPLDQLPKLISDIRKERLSGDLNKTRDNLTVAFCLPHAAFSLEVERWKIIVGETEFEIGRKYPVVIRSFERLYGGREDTWGQWGRLWDRIVKNEAEDAPVCWFCEEVTADGFMDAMLCQDIVCAALAHPSGASLVANTIDVGIPVVIWTRSTDHCSSQMRTLLEPLLGRDLRKLPTRLYEERRRGASPFNRVAILWDPHDRLPPDADEDAAFAAPER